MAETQTGWPRISSAVFYEEAGTAIDWLCRAFGFEVRLKVEGEGGSIEHSELTFGDGVIMVGTIGEKRARPERAFCVSPRSIGGSNTQSLCLRVEDVDSLCERARAAGGVIEVEPTTNDYGEEYDSHRSCQVVDPEGHRWWLMQVMRSAPPRGK
jgi:uncharacterized glyoxalase superfamily protein PhnB